MEMQWFCDKKDASKSQIIWVGKATEGKRPELFFRLAKNFPEFRFLMIAPPTRDIKYYKKIKEAASKIDNLDFMEYVLHNKIDRYYAESLMFINTSFSEGFPNTFLEAWGNYLPIVSIGFDPDEIICKNKIGFHPKTFEQMVKDVKTLLKNENLRKEMGLSARRYVEKEHEVKRILNEYQRLFKKHFRGVE